MIEFASIKPLEAPNRGFDRSEFSTRVANAQVKMKEQGIDGLLLLTEPDVRYFTGYHTQFWQSPTRPWFLIVPQSGDPVAVIPGIGTECMANTGLKDIRTWGSPHPDDDGVSLLCNSLNEICGDAAKIGMLMGRETSLRMPLIDFEKIKLNLAKSQFIDATALVQGLRVVKSEAEIEKIGHAAAIASAAFDLVPQFAHVGMSEIEVFRNFKMALLAYGGDDPAFLVGGADQGGYGDIISPPSTRTLQDNDILILDTGCIWDGYFCDFDRNFAIGSVDEKAAEAHRITWDATQAGIEAARPGARCADLFHAMNSIMAPHAIESGGDVGRLGHGLGMQLTEFPSHTSWDQTELVDGMVLTIEPGFTFAPNKMMVHEENIVVRGNNPQTLSKRAPREIPVIC